MSKDNNLHIPQYLQTLSFRKLQKKIAMSTQSANLPIF